MKLYEKHERFSFITRWTGRYKKHSVTISEMRDDYGKGKLTGYYFLSDCEAYNFISLWKFPPYKSLDEAEKAAIKYIDDEIKEHGND